MSCENDGCRMGVYCERHRFVHGYEAEELRRGIEELIKDGVSAPPGRLQRLLDRVDARDSVCCASRASEALESEDRS